MQRFTAGKGNCRVAWRRVYAYLLVGLLCEMCSSPPAKATPADAIGIFSGVKLKVHKMVLSDIRVIGADRPRYSRTHVIPALTRTDMVEDMPTRA